MSPAAWILISAALLILWAALGILAILRAPIMEDMPEPERPALTRPVVRHLSVSDRLRRKAVAQARREAMRTSRQLRAHLQEFAEAREAEHA